KRPIRRRPSRTLRIGRWLLRLGPDVPMAMAPRHRQRPAETVGVGPAGGALRADRAVVRPAPPGRRRARRRCTSPASAQASEASLKVVRTRRSVRLVDGPDLVSHLRTTPGPTHGFFDLLAACAAAFAPGDLARAPRVLLLGFAAGGILAPLRAL